MHDSKRTVIEKRRAAKAFYKIQAQLKDPVLMKLREALSKATYAEDKEWIWKYTNQIKEHLKEPLIPEGDM